MAAVLATALGLGSALAPAPALATSTPATTPTAVIAEFTRISHWPSGYLGSFTVRNGTNSTLDGWRVAFDLPADTRVVSWYGGVFASDGTRHTVTNTPWNGQLAPGASVTFGWVAEGQGVPGNCSVNGASCAGQPLDHTPPSRPGPLELDLSNGVTLHWAPSTDDHGPVTYEVYESGRLLGKTSDNEYVYTTGTILPPRIYVFSVRAVDAAGNVSASAYRTLGQIWRGDEIPELPSALRVDAPAPGLLRLSWTEAPSGISIFITPPVAGYEVHLDGELVGQAGGTEIVIPRPDPGPHTFTVRTISAVDQYSEPVELAFRS